MYQIPRTARHPHTGTSACRLGPRIRGEIALKHSVDVMTGTCMVLLSSMSSHPMSTTPEPGLLGRRRSCVWAIAASCSVDFILARFLSSLLLSMCRPRKTTHRHGALDYWSFLYAGPAKESPAGRPFNIPITTSCSVHYALTAGECHAIPPGRACRDVDGPVGRGVFSGHPCLWDNMNVNMSDAGSIVGHAARSTGIGIPSNRRATIGRKEDFAVP
ncbi:hypothetical protein C8Q77DRAFT_11998 [Trametes polyzona]|nr:hypothetical protein C8Q77DRAFT_11998 [Trametes polyzona]